MKDAISGPFEANLRFLPATGKEVGVYAPWSIGLRSVEHRPTLHGASAYAPRSVEPHACRPLSARAWMGVGKAGVAHFFSFALVHTIWPS